MLIYVCKNAKYVLLQYFIIAKITVLLIDSFLSFFYQKDSRDHLTYSWVHSRSPNLLTGLLAFGRRKISKGTVSNL